MNLLQRTARLEALAVSETRKRESAAFKDWIRGLTREEGLAFLEFCLPTLVKMGIAPTYTVLPTKLPAKERREYAEAFQNLIAEHKAQSACDSMDQHRMIMDLWRRFVQRAAGGSRSQQVA
jgi:hypothetical protein